METTKWKDITGWEGFYQASDSGQIRSVARITTSRPAKGVVLKQCVQNSGYLVVGLNKNGKHKSCLVHRLIAFTYIENPNNKGFVNHIDGNKKNNFLNNLEWCTKSENLTHAFRTGLKVISKKHITRLKRFNTETKSIPIARYDKSGNLIEEYASGVEAAEKTGLDYSSIMAASTGKYRNHKTCGGFIWKRLQYVEVEK